MVCVNNKGFRLISFVIYEKKENNYLDKWYFMFCVYWYRW